MRGSKRIARYIGGALVVVFALYFGTAPARAQHTGHAPAPAKPEEKGSMPGMPGMPSEEKAAPETSPEAPRVEIPPEKQQLIGVKTVKAAVRPLQKTIRTVGKVEYDESRIATVNTKIEGWIEKLYVNVTGQYVKKGAPLVEIYSPELYASQQEFLNVLKWAKKQDNNTKQTDQVSKMVAADTESIVNAARQRLKFWDISDAQIDKIAKTGKPVRTLALYSPVSGYVIQKSALQGMRVMPGEKLFDVADLSSLWITAEIYQYELPLVKPGQQARINLSYLPGQEFSSRIDYVYPALSSETRTAKVRFKINKPTRDLKPQMFTTVEIKINLGKKLAVPDSAILDTGTEKIAYVDTGEGQFEPRQVLTGVRTDNMVEIVKGLKAGDVVASSANFLIDSEAQLKGIKPLPVK